MFEPRQDQNLRWLWGQCAPYRRTILFIACLLIISAVMVLGLVRYVRYMMAKPSYDLSSIINFIAILTSWFLILSMLTWLRYRLSTRVVTHRVSQWRQEILTRALRQPFWFWIETNPSRLLHVSETECATLEWFGLQILPHAFRHAVTFLGAFILLSFVHTRLSFLLLTGLCCCFVPLRFVLKNSRMSQEQLRSQETSLRQHVTELFQGLLLIHTAGKTKDERSSLKMHIAQYQKAVDMHSEIRARMLGLIIFFIGVVIVSLTGWILMQAWHQALETSDAFEFLIYAALLASSLNSLAEAVPHVQKAWSIVQNVRTWLEMPLPHDLSIVVETDSDPAIVLDHVSYRFASTSFCVIDDVSIKIPFGAKVGIIGPSGSGKSTLLSLIMGLYKPESGSVCLSRHAPHRFKPEHRAYLIGLASQEPAFVTRTLRDHLIYGSSRAYMDEDLLTLLKDLDLEDWVLGLPDGLETLLGPYALNLSLGQKQRLMLGQLRLQDPLIYALDEATSGLDVITEDHVLDHLQSWVQHRTCLMVTHKLSLVRNMDMILFLCQGRLTGVGSHQELLDTHPLYQSFVALQWPLEL